MSKTTKIQRRSKPHRLPKDFHWKLLKKISDALPYSTFRAQTLRHSVDSAIRKRDLNGYLSLCKNSLSLRALQLYVRQEGVAGEDHLRIIRELRFLTCFQKFDFPDSTLDKQAAAVRAFLDFEDLCLQTNLDPIFVNFTNDEDDGSESTEDCIFFGPILRYAKQFIVRTIGTVPQMEDFLANLRHGPGASTEKKGQDSIPIEKWIPPIGVSPNCFELFCAVIGTDERWIRSLAAFSPEDYPNTAATDSLQRVSLADLERFVMKVESSRVMFVPKDAEKFRTISVEPTANVYLQLGIDGLIRPRLRRWGIDLDNQTRNQKLACRASKDDTLVTADLSGASDSIANIWTRLFPINWQIILSALRSRVGELPDGEVVHFQKLSAMGNGFTFCIETLIFAAVLYGVIRVNGEKWESHRDDIAIYGDDLIYPVKFHGDFSRALRRFGFRLNQEKTFPCGPIRESCGTDYYLGDRIDRPTFKEFPKESYELVVMFNLLKDYAVRYNFDFSDVLHFILSYIPPSDRFFGPVNENVVCWLHSDDPDIFPVWRDDYQAYFYQLKCRVVGHRALWQKKWVRSQDGTKQRILLAKRLPPRYQAVLPLMYLNRFSPSLEKRFNQQRTESSDFCPSRFFFLKSSLEVHTSITLIPLETW